MTDELERVVAAAIKATFVGGSSGLDDMADAIALEHARAALAAIEAQGMVLVPRPESPGWEKSPWQPIETAPTDGTRVLLLFPADDVAVGWRIDQNWWLSAIWSGSFAYLAPTHWKPIAAPAPGGEE